MDDRSKKMTRNNVKELRNLVLKNPNEVNNEIIEKLKHLAKEELIEFIGYWKNEEECKTILEVLKIVGFPQIGCTIEYLLKNLEDLNMTGAFIVADFLIKIGDPIVPFIKDILRGNHEKLIYNILIEVVEKLSREIVVELEEDLDRLTWSTGFEDGYQIDALRILAKFKIWDNERLIGKYNFLNSTYNFFIKKLIEDEIFYRECK
jgi:hypothetical protein